MKKIVVALLLICSLNGYSQEFTVAVAANAHDVVAELIASFEKEQSVKVNLVSGASGTLNSQIKNGAPFDLFMAADTTYTQELYRQGLTVGRPSVYAIGKLVLCSTRLKDLSKWAAYLLNHPAEKIAIANPIAAPYGRATIEFLHSVSLLDKIKKTVIYGTSISQVNLYIITGTVSMGFTSMSFIKECEFKKQQIYWLAPDPKSYHQIAQEMVLLKNGRNESKKNAALFYTYLLSKQARLIFTKYGYSI